MKLEINKLYKNGRGDVYKVLSLEGIDPDFSVIAQDVFSSQLDSFTVDGHYTDMHDVDDNMNLREEVIQNPWGLISNECVDCFIDDEYEDKFDMAIAAWKELAMCEGAQKTGDYIIYNYFDRFDVTIRGVESSYQFYIGFREEEQAIAAAKKLGEAKLNALFMTKGVELCL